MFRMHSKWITEEQIVIPLFEHGPRSRRNREQAPQLLIHG